MDNEVADDDPLREDIMGVSRFAALAAALLVATSLAGCASTYEGTLHVQDARDGSDFSLGKSKISSDEWLDLEAQPDAERRRRLDALVAAHPDDLPARFDRLGMAYASYGMEFKSSDEATVLADSEALLAEPALNGHARRLVLDWRAETLSHAGRREEAIAAADLALAIDGADSRALLTRGWARYQSEAQSDDALADLERGLQLEPDSTIAHYWRAVVLQSRGVLDRAAQDYEFAVQHAPNDADYHRDYGVLLYQRHELVGALAQFDIALRLAPRDPDNWAWRAQADLALGRLPEAAGDDRRIDELGAARADIANSYRRVAFALEDQLDFAGAERQFRRALRLESTPADAYWLARMLWFNGHFEEPVAYFRERAAAPKHGAYMPIWLFVARGRADPADEAVARAELAAFAPAHEPREWTDTLVDLMLGKTTLDAALAEADAAPDYKLKAGRRCEADYYAAEELLMHGQKDAASRLLQEAYWVCPSTYVEAHAVVAQRRLLEAGPSSR